MEKYFADDHASAASQLGGLPCALADTPEAAALRGAADYDGLLALAKALDFQLRYRESLPVYARAIALRPQDRTGYRRRAPRYINTLQPEKAAADQLKCRALGGADDDIAYRLGIAYYLMGDDESCMREEALCFPLLDDEMGVAAMYWHTLAAWRSRREPALLDRHYHTKMAVGHHTAYNAVMALGSGAMPWGEMRALLENTEADLEYSMLAYGAAAWLRREGRAGEAGEMLNSILPRDGFWISYTYIAAWNDLHPTARAE